MEYFLMRKDDVVTICDFSEDGEMLSYVPNYKNPELSPLAYRRYADHLKRWWRNRQIPLRQGRVEEMLAERGLVSPGELTLSNLGLSLTDYYWLKPIDSDLKWKNVNLFENDFRENILYPPEQNSNTGNSTAKRFSPNSTLRGELEKSWVIHNGQRVLIKGNHGSSSAESINEVIATELHSLQGYDNHTKYNLIRIKAKKYDYGCFCNLFTDIQQELVSAYDVITSEPPVQGESTYEQLIRLAVKHGIDGVQFRNDLEYQILTDYLLTNIDRHMDNIGILRDADTLKFLRMAPIFDSGRAFAAGYVVPYTDYELDNVEINSFASYEKDLLKLVTNPGLIDLSRVVSPERIAELYHMDSKAEEYRISDLLRLYEYKRHRLSAL